MTGKQGIDYTALNLVFRDDKGNGISMITGIKPRYSPGYVGTHTIGVRNDNYVEDTEQTQNDSTNIVIPEEQLDSEASEKYEIENNRYKG